MLDRDTIIHEAIERCLEEMYQKSQPKGSYLEYCKLLKEGKLDRETRVFERHYLCHNQFEYILHKYIKAYRLQNEWKSDIEFLVDNLKNGGYRDVYKNWPNGTKYRTSEQMEPITNIIGEENAKKLFEYIDIVKNFYRFDSEERKFNFQVCLGASPTSNPETVKEYWESQGVDIQIDTTELSADDYWEIDEYGHVLEEEEE